MPIILIAHSLKMYPPATVNRYKVQRSINVVSNRFPVTVHQNRSSRGPQARPARSGLMTLQGNDSHSGPLRATPGHSEISDTLLARCFELLGRLQPCPQVRFRTLADPCTQRFTQNPKHSGYRAQLSLIDRLSF